MLFDSRALKTGHRLARLGADRAALRFVHGLRLLMDGGMTPVGSTPRSVVWRRGKQEVWHYTEREAEEYDLGHDTFAVDTRTLPIPILLVPPIMVRPYVFDLRPEHSMVRALRRANFNVFLVDFGVPDDDDLTVKIDDYVLDYLPHALAAVRRATGRAEVSLVGYCMGGILSLLYTAAFADRGVKNIVTIASPIDMSKMGMLTAVARLANRGAPALVDRVGNIPGRLSSEALKLLAPVKRFTRFADLFVNLWNEEYVRGHEAMARWSNEFIAYPRDAFKQFLREFLVENRLVERMSFGERTADLRDVECALLAFAGQGDTVATPASARAICELTGSKDFEYVEVPGGHIGVVAGGGARAAVWDKTAAWLRPRSV